MVISTTYQILFQSTLPRRERQATVARRRVDSDFNPRSREGSDAVKDAAGSVQANFNPRSREGSDDGV